MKLIVSIASGSNNTERNILRSFHDGILAAYSKKFDTDDLRVLKKQHGIDLRLSYDPEIEKCDLAVQFGTVKDRANEHHITKQNIRKNARHVVYIETPLLGRVINKNNDYLFYRVGVNGFLNNDGIFFKEELLDHHRLNYLRTQITIQEFPGWKDHSAGNILILLQIPGDASLRGQRMSEWLVDTVTLIRKNTNRPIAIRFHPATSEKGKAEIFSEVYPLLFKNFKNIQWNDGSTSLTEDFESAGVCVSYTSGSSIDAVLHGVPVIAMDEGNLTYPISSHRLDQLKNPRLASTEEIEKWLISLANSQWDEREMVDGVVWERLLPIIEELMNENSNDIPQLST